jgi:hypothetical protein
MPRWWITGLGIFEEVVALEVRYHPPIDAGAAIWLRALTGFAGISQFDLRRGSSSSTHCVLHRMRAAPSGTKPTIASAVA